MKKLGLILLVILLVIGGTACASEKPKETPKPPETLKTEEAPKEKKPEIEKKKAETKKEEPEPVPTVVDEDSSPPQIWFEFYDPLGKSHNALIENPDFLQRINAILDTGSIQVDDIMPDMGGATQLRIEENGGVRSLIFAEAIAQSKEIPADGEPPSLESGGRVLGMGDEWYAMPDPTLEKELFAAYHTDLYRAEPEDTYLMSLSYDYVEIAQVEGEKEGQPISGTMARVELDNKVNEADISRIQQVLENSQRYTAAPIRTGQQAGKYIGVGISDKDGFKEYTFFLQPDGSLLFTVSYVLNRAGVEADPNWYKVADPSLYQHLLTTYFPNEPV